MKAAEVSAGRLFASDQQLLIPLWQRHYSWEYSEWSELWGDLTRIQDHNLSSHFLGSIVLKTLPWSGMPSEARRYWVVDGQQRITTLTLLICAIRDRLAQLESTDEGREKVMKEITGQLLKNTNLQEGHQDRLVLQERDRASLAPLVNGTASGEGRSLVERANTFFKRELAKSNKDEVISLLSLVLTKLSAVWVTLEDGDNPHRVFQTLNAGGKQLRQADLVRNYFFLLLAEEGDEFYGKSWRLMEQDLSDKELDDYLVAWAISQGYSGSRDSLFSYFHRDLLPFEDSVAEVLSYGARLTGTARQFRWIRQPADSTLPKEVTETLTDLRNWATLPAEGLMLWLLRQHQASVIDSPQLRSSLEILLSFMARRQLAGYEPNLHKSIFVSAARRLANAAQLSGQEVVDYLHFLLSDGDEVRTWPGDDEIKAVTRSTPVYSESRSAWAFSVLERVNRRMFAITKHSPPTIDRGKHTVEHVLPQTMTPEWVQDLTDWGVDNPNQLHQSHLHVLGNLTLTPINSELGNMRFEVKRKKLTDDWLRLNLEVVESTTWTESRINERSTALASLACQAYVAPLAPPALTQARERFAEMLKPAKPLDDENQGNEGDEMGDVQS